MRTTKRHFYEFGCFRLDEERHRLFKNGEPVALPPKAAETLLILVKHPGKLLEREALMEAVWKDVFVEDSNLTVAISQLRRALAGSSAESEYIQTIPRVGYRFVADVREVTEEPAPLVVEKHTLAETIIEEEYLASDAVATESTSTTKSLRFAKAFNFRVVGLLVAAALAIGILVISTFNSKRADTRTSAAAIAPRSITSIAVLPPRSLQGKGEDSALSLGIADAVITRLGALRKLKVLPTSTITRYLAREDNPLDIGKALRVDAVLEGSLQRAEGRVRVSLRLLESESQKQIWTGSFDELDGNIFKLQDSIAEQVAIALALNLSSADEKLLSRKSTVNREAYEEYLKGSYLLNKRAEHAIKANPFFRRAIELDPTFVDAYVGLATVHAFGANWPEAEIFAEKALKLDPNLAEAHAIYGFIKMFRRWDWEAAGESFNRAVTLNPNSGTAHHWKGVYLSLLGRIEEAKAEMHEALKLDPLSLIILSDIGQLHYFAHDYDKAAEICFKVLSLDSTFSIAHIYLSSIYRMKGMEKEVFEHSLAALPPEAKATLTPVYETSGLRGVTELQIKRNGNPKNPSPLTNFEVANLYNDLHDREQTITLLQHSLNERAFMLPFINVDPKFDWLRSDPRFQAIVTNIGLAK